MTLDCYMFSNEGGKSKNEDCVSFDIKNDEGIFVLADGLGGHQLGEKASKCVCDSLIEAWSVRNESDDIGDSDDIEEWLKTQIAIANEKVIELQNEEHTIMKSTVVSLIIDSCKAIWANVGDSRLYYFHNGNIASNTEDHSVSYKKYKAGEITRVQLATDEDQCCLLRALGNEERNQPDINRTYENLSDGDGFLLCSDGFWEYVMEQEMVIDLHKSKTAENWINSLLLRAIKRVGTDNDNLSVIAVLVKGDREAGM